MIRNFSKRLFSRLHKPWVHATVGSALILLSTLVSGYFGYQNQNKADDLRAEISEITKEIAESERQNDFAHLINTLNDIQDLAAGLADTRLRAEIDRQIVITEFEVANRMSLAAGKGTLDLSIMKEAEDQAFRGEKETAVLKILNLRVGLVTDIAKYQTTLVTHVAGLEQRLRSLERSRNRLVLIALVLQVLGLVFLLVKEVPHTVARN